MNHDPANPPQPDAGRDSRRAFLGWIARGAALAGLGALAVRLARRAPARDWVWQLDPALCQQCGRCATACVLQPSAVRCMHAFYMCGYCELCTGFFEPKPTALTTGAENQLCPLGAIRRRYVEDPYYEYRIDRPRCVGCGKCVKGCGQFGNGSLYLQVQRDLCMNCNECAIARVCPAGAYRRVPASPGYIARQSQHG